MTAAKLGCLTPEQRMLIETSCIQDKVEKNECYKKSQL